MIRMRWALALSLAVTGWANAQELTDPADVLQGVGSAISEQLLNDKARYEAQPELLSDLVRDELLPVMDISYSARLILGRAGRGATPEQIQAFGNAMTRLLIERYSEGLLNFQDREQIEVLPTRGEISPKMTRVRTRVRMLNGKHIPVDYACRMTDEGWKVFDVIVEGISYVTTYRNQIQPQVQEHGIDGMIQRLDSGEIKIAN